MSASTAKERRQQIDRRQNSVADRRRQGEGRYAIFEVCRSMLRLALVVHNAGAEGSADRIITRSIRWRKEAASLNTDQGIHELTEAVRTLVTEERLSGAKGAHCSGWRILRDSRHYWPNGRCSPRICRTRGTQPALSDTWSWPEGTRGLHSAARRPASTRSVSSGQPANVGPLNADLGCRWLANRIDRAVVDRT